MDIAIELIESMLVKFRSEKNGRSKQSSNVPKRILHGPQPWKVTVLQIWLLILAGQYTHELKPFF